MIVVFDFETGGLTDDHPNIQLAAVAIDDSYSVVDSFERKLAFDVAAADPEALEINSYDPELWVSAVSEDVAIRDFCNWLRPYCCVHKISKKGNSYRVARLAGHNAAGFDFPRLQTACRRIDAFLPADFHVLDTMQCAVWRSQKTGDWPENLRLSTVCNYYGVAVEGAHDALSDCKMTAGLVKVFLNE